MKVIDTDRKWLQDLPPYWMKGLEELEADALRAKDKGLLFFSISYSDSRMYNMDTALTLVTELGWEYVSTVNQPSREIQFLFKRVKETP